MKTCPMCKASFDENKCERKLVYKKQVIYCPNCGTELVKQPPFIAIVLLCLLYACIKHLMVVDGLEIIVLVLSIVLYATAPYKEYGKKSKIVTPIDIVVFVIIVLLGIFAVFMDNETKRVFTPVEAMIDSEWIDLNHYECEYDEYVGKEPVNLLDNIYSINGLSADEYLYAEKIYLLGKNTTEVLMMNDSVEEPIKRFPFKSIKIMREGEDTVIIEDKKVLNAVSELLANDIRIESMREYSNENTIIETDTESQLMWYCWVEVTEDEQVLLIGEDAKTRKYYKYDLTDIFNEYSIELE